MEVIRGLDKEKGARIPESCGSQASEPRDRAPGCLIIGRVPAPFRYMKIFFLLSASCAFGADLDSLGIIRDGAGLGPPVECGGWNDGGVVAETIERKGGRERNGLWFC